MSAAGDPENCAHPSELHHVRVIERVRFETCDACQAIWLFVDDQPVNSAEDFLARVGGESEAERIGALLRGEG